MKDEVAQLKPHFAHSLPLTTAGRAPYAAISDVIFENY